MCFIYIQFSMLKQINFIEIIKTFLLLFLACQLCITVYVNFLDLIVDSGYPVSTYFSIHF